MLGQEKEADNVITKWQQTCSDLESKIARLESNVANSSNRSSDHEGHLQLRIDELSTKLATSESKLSNAEGRLQIVSQQLALKEDALLVADSDMNAKAERIDELEGIP